MTPKTKKYLGLSLQIIIAISYLQTLRFKFTAHPDSVFIFSKLNLEPYGRIGIGVFELITAILILYPKTKIIGGVLSIAVILGAIASHIGVLGIEIRGDGGTLFYFALFVLLCSVIFLWLNKVELKNLIINIKSKLISK